MILAILPSRIFQKFICRVCSTTKNNRFKSLGTPERVWAVSAIHGDVERLTRIHDALIDKAAPGDRIVYTGNYTGYGEQSAECIEELLTFRRLFLSQRGVVPGDLIYLRGAQEEMWQKLLQIQFAPDPAGVLLWMLGNGISATLYSYGLSPHDGIESCRAGTMALTKWTNSIRAAVRARAGHEIFGNHLNRAAHTSIETDYPLLFVHAGIDTAKKLEDQGDNLWWSGSDFEDITEEYTPFGKVVRGYDPAHKGVKMNCVTATIDGGCGFGGSLVCAGFESSGQTFEILEI